MRNPKVEKVRGVNDVLPHTYAVEQAIARELTESFTSFGYQPLDLPVLEHTELFARKSGEELLGRMYDFHYHSRRLCLRPELTASAVRAYVDHLQGEPLPVRLCYQGPVFRYEKPQRGRYRQFTQIGGELIGVTGVMADAEIMAIAVKSLERLGLQNFRLVLGNIAVLNQFLSDRPLENRLRNFLLAQMEVFRREGRSAVEKRLQAIHQDFHPSSEPQTLLQPSSNRLQQLFAEMTAQEAQLTIIELIESLNLRVEGTRGPDEIADRLMTKIKRQDQNVLLNQTLAFMAELTQLRGEPQAVLQAAQQVLTHHQIDSAPLQQLQAILQLLQSYQLDFGRIELDFGLSRGLQYYTGTVFEIHHEDLGQERQLCGGGRYDDLVTVFGGKPNTAATGFSFGLERIRLALESEKRLPKTAPLASEVIVIAVSPQEHDYAVTVAEKLRHGGLQVQLDVRDRNLSGNFTYAAKQGIPVAVVVGSTEKAATTVVIKDLTSRDQQDCPLAAAIPQIQALIANS